MQSNHIIYRGASLRSALAAINALPGGAMTLFVLDGDDGTMVGTLTDGDVRRALLAGLSLDADVAGAAMTAFRYVRHGEHDVEALRLYRLAGITLIPVLDADGRLVDIIDLNRTHNILPLRAVLMAGGVGERLRPATLTTPKPLLQIEGKAIIDYNIEALAACGITDITVTTRYLADAIDAHFATPVAGVAVKTFREDRPLGTIGSIAGLRAGIGVPASVPAQGANTIGVPAHKATLVMNSDLLTTISFEDMYLTHTRRHADVTIAVVPYQVSVPYAILSIDADAPTRVAGIQEKPSYSYYANAGIYIFSDDILAMLTPGERCDATDLIERAIAAGANVTYYTIKGTWIDVGSPTDFRQAQDLMRHHNALKHSNR